MSEAQDFFRALADRSPVGVFHIDAQGHCTYANAIWLAMIGSDAERGLGSGWTATLHPADRDAFIAQWGEAMQAGSAIDLEARFCVDGAVRLLRTRGSAVRDAAGTITGCVGSAADITERMRVIDRLRASEAWLDRIGRIAGVGGWVFDLATQHLLWSDQTCRIHDRPPGHQPTLDEAIGYYAAQAQPVIRDALGTALREGRAWDLELPFVSASGRALWVRSVGEVEHEQGRAVRLIGAFQDITERRRRQDELRQEQDLRLQLQAHASELDRLVKERGRMLDVLAHEVRQPLNNASAALQSAEGVLADLGDSKAAERLRRAQAVMSQVMASIDNTLAAASLLARAEGIEREDVDIDTLLALCIGDLPAGDRGRVHIERGTPTRTASMDMSLMRLALRNVLANAVKYSPGDQPVTVRITDSDEPLALVVDVIDRGPGVEAALLPRLFQRGARGQQAGHSSSHGLGLYIVRRVMELHGGSVRLLKNNARGATMRLMIGQSGP